MFTIIWQFTVKPERTVDFERANGPAGTWARFYGQDAGYLGVELLRDADVVGRYFTIDRWRSRDEYESFMATHQDEFDSIDRACDVYTLDEKKLGCFSSAEE